MMQKDKSRNVLASPLGEEGHEVAKGCTRVRMIMTLEMDVTAERRHYNTHCPLKGKRLTTFCASLALLPNVFAVHRFAQGPPIGNQENDRVSYLCSAPYTLLPLRGISPQGETRDMERKTGRHILHVPFRCVPLWWLAPPPSPR